MFALQTVPRTRIDLNKKTTTDLRPIFEAHQNDFVLLQTISDVLEPRTGEKSIALRAEVEQRLKERPTPAPIHIHTSRPWTIKAAIVGTLLVIATGIGHEFGAEIWKAVGPKVKANIGFIDKTGADHEPSVYGVQSPK